MSRYRKAVAAFLTAMLSLPVAAWVGGSEPFSWQTLASALVAAAFSAASVWAVPNTPPEPDPEAM